jgi:hypothetical protein
MTSRFRLAAASTALLMLALAGCASSTGAAPSGTAVPPPVDTGTMEASAAWLDDGRMIGVVTHGSSTCVPIAEEVEGSGQTITVALVDPDAKACSADLAPRATAIVVPKSVDRTKDVTIVITGAVEDSVELDGRHDLTGTGQTDYLPSAGWSTESEFVVLTWGSSGCAPSVESVTAKDEHAIALAFAEFPADQVCTADMAPRLVVAAVPNGFGDEDDVTLTLTGGGVTGTTPILGDR